MSKLKLTAIALAVLCCFSLELAAQTRAKDSGGSVISGRVTLKEEPMRGVTVILQQQQSSPFVPILPSDMASSPRAKTDANGFYLITGVAPGRYNVRAATTGFVDSYRGSPGMGS